MNIIKKLTVIWLLLCSSFVFSNEVGIVHLESEVIVKQLASWDNGILRKQLEIRYEDNDSLLEFIMLNDLSETDLEVDADYNRAVNNLLDDQKGLNYFTKHLVAISTQENLNIDDFLSKMSGIKNQFKEDLIYISGEQEARVLINRLLYLSLMKKHSMG